MSILDTILHPNQTITMEQWNKQIKSMTSIKLKENRKFNEKQKSYSEWKKLKLGPLKRNDYKNFT